MLYLAGYAEVKSWLASTAWTPFDAPSRGTVVLFPELTGSVRRPHAEGESPALPLATDEIPGGQLRARPQRPEACEAHRPPPPDALGPALPDPAKPIAASVRT